MEKNQPNQHRHLVIIAGYYGFDNLGDEAILEELINELSSLYDRESIVVLSHNPRKTASLFQVKSLDRWDWFEYLKLLKEAKLLVSGGGGLFQDRTGFGSVIFYSAQILLARLCGAKVLIYAQGLGPLRHIFSKTLSRIAFKQANKITVRDSNSLTLIADWGLTANLTADPVWALSSNPLPQPIQAMLKTIKENNHQRMIVGLSLRDDQHLRTYHLESLAKSIIQALPDRSAILLLPLQTDRDQKPLETMERFLVQSSLETYWFDPGTLDRPSQWLTLLENIDILVGMRFHALLMALKAGKPVIGIAYDQKVNQLLDHFEQPVLSLNTNENQCQTVWPKVVENALTSKENLANLVKAKLITTKQLANQNIKSLAETLEVDISVTSTSH